MLRGAKGAKKIYIPQAPRDVRCAHGVVVSRRLSARADAQGLRGRATVGPWHGPWNAVSSMGLFVVVAYMYSIEYVFLFVRIVSLSADNWSKRGAEGSSERFGFPTRSRERPPRADERKLRGSNTTGSPREAERTKRSKKERPGRPRPRLADPAARRRPKQACTRAQVIAVAP